MTAYFPPTFSDDKRFERLQKLFPEVDKIFAEFARKWNMPGYAFGLVFDGKFVHSRFAGYSDIKRSLPVTDKTLFYVASITKSFTAMAILQLRDAGKLNLDDLLSRYLPELPEQSLTSDASPLTIRSLLTQCAGLPQDDPWADRKCATTQELFDLLKEGVSFSNPPGFTYEYSNLGYVICGALIEKVTGVPYQKYIVQNIWAPLGMQDALWDYSQAPSADLLARGYAFKEEKFVEETLLSHNAFGAMGGMISSLDSLSRYVAFHQQAWPPREESQGILKRSSVREMHTPHTFIELLPEFKYRENRVCALAKAYGHGLLWMQDSEKRVFSGHSGGLPGFGSNWYIMPDYGIGIVSLTNLTYVPMTFVNLHVLDFIVQEAHLQPRKLPVSLILEKRKEELLTFLPTWEGVEKSVLFADNFFQDCSLQDWKKQTALVFESIGKIQRVGEMQPSNQLRGSFILYGERGNGEVSFTLTPEREPRIQKLLLKV